MITLTKTMVPSRSPTLASVGSDGNGTDAPNVAGPVYLAAFGLEQGESIGAPLAQGRRPPR